VAVLTARFEQCALTAILLDAICNSLELERGVDSLIPLNGSIDLRCQFAVEVGLRPACALNGVQICLIEFHGVQRTTRGGAHSKFGLRTLYALADAGKPSHHGGCSRNLRVLDGMTQARKITQREFNRRSVQLQSHKCRNRSHGFSPADIFAAAERFNYSPDTLKTRLLHASMRADDPGIETPTGVAPTFEQLRIYFAEQINSLEQAQAATALAEEAVAPPGPTTLTRTRKASTGKKEHK
jgi:hypothetical protein